MTDLLDRERRIRERVERLYRERLRDRKVPGETVEDLA